MSRDVTFDETSMVKLTDSQQVESEKTSRISQQVESNVTPAPPDRTILFEITPEVTQSGDHVSNEDADDDEDQEPVMGDIQDSIAVGRTQRNPRKPSWLTTNMIYGLCSSSH